MWYLPAPGLPTVVGCNGFPGIILCLPAASSLLWQYTWNSTCQSGPNKRLIYISGSKSALLLCYIVGCGSGGGVGSSPATGSAVRALVSTAHMLICSWARHRTANCSRCVWTSVVSQFGQKCVVLVCSKWNQNHLMCRVDTRESGQFFLESWETWRSNLLAVKSRMSAASLLWLRWCELLRLIRLLPEINQHQQRRWGLWEERRVFSVWWQSEWAESTGLCCWCTVGCGLGPNVTAAHEGRDLTWRRAVFKAQRWFDSGFLGKLKTSKAAGSPVQQDFIIYVYLYTAQASKCCSCCSVTLLCPYLSCPCIKGSAGSTVDSEPHINSRLPGAGTIDTGAGLQTGAGWGQAWIKDAVFAS